MDLTMWGSVLNASMLRLIGGDFVSVAVVLEGSAYKLKWKRSTMAGWPDDADAVPVATLAKVEAFVMLEVPQGVLIGNGVDLFWLTRNTNPTSGASFEVVTVLA